MKKIRVYTDGASRGNPGQASIGIVVTDENEVLLETYKKFAGKLTNNAAEYSALIESVRLLKRIKIEFDEINFYCDSELIVKQLNGQYKIKNRDMMHLSLEFFKEIHSLNKKYKVSHIPREQNKLADKLANEALDEQRIIDLKKNLIV